MSRATGTPGTLPLHGYGVKTLTTSDDLDSPVRQR